MMLTSQKARRCATLWSLFIFPWQQADALRMARLLHLDVECVAKFAFVRGNLWKRVFFHKIHRFLPLCVLGNRSKTLLLPIICKLTNLPTASRPHSEGISLKSHRLNSTQALFPPPPCFTLVTINSATLPTVPTAPNTPFLIFAFLSRLQLSHNLCLFVLTSSHPHFLQ